MIIEKLDDFYGCCSGRLLGLDVGKAAIGMALSDTEQMIATPMDVLMRENMHKDTGRIRTVIREYEVGGIVIGLPKLMSGEEGDSCVMVRAFVLKLDKKTALPCLLYDERLTTQAVDRVLRETDMTRKKRHAVDDKMAAAYILQSVLDGKHIVF